MRVMFWSELFWPHIGGAEIFGSNLIVALQKRGYEFIVVTRQDSPALPSKENHKGIQVYRFPFWTTFTDRNAVDRLVHVRRQVIQLKRTFSPDLVHLQGYGPSSVLFHLTTMNACPAPVLFTLINEPSAHGAEHESLKRVLRSADWVTGKAATVLAQARRLMPEIIPRSSVIYNGLEVLPVLPEPLPVESPRLLCLCRLSRQKGIDLVLKALASITDRLPKVRLIIAGDGPERPQLERQAAGLGVEDKVDFVGWVSPAKVPALINTATAVLMPSRTEGLPSVALQAAMMARPLVATPVGGLSEVVVDRQTGLLVAPEDPTGLAEAIVHLLEHPETAAQMGQAARRRVQEVFSWRQCVDAYDALYRKLAKRTLPGVECVSAVHPIQTRAGEK
jgi:glycogen synthase